MIFRAKIKQTGPLAEDINPIVGLSKNKKSLSDRDRMNVMHMAIIKLRDNQKKMRQKIVNQQQEIDQLISNMPAGNAFQTAYQNLLVEIIHNTNITLKI